MNNQVSFKFGSLANYNALTTKDSDTLYFVDGVIYKGTDLYGGKVEFINGVSPTNRPSTPSQGVIYVYNDFTSEIYTTNGWRTFNVGNVSTIDDTSVANDGKLVTQAAIKSYISSVVSDIGDDIDDLRDDLEQEINTRISSVFRYKGTVANYAGLSDKTDAIVGDVWLARDTSKEYVCISRDESTTPATISWEELGHTVDLSGYATTADLDDVDEKVVDLGTDFDQHVSNQTEQKHVSSTDITNWNAKATTTYADTAASTAAAAAQSAAISSANSYTDTALGGYYTKSQTYSATEIDSQIDDIEDILTWKTIVPTQV